MARSGTLSRDGVLECNDLQEHRSLRSARLSPYRNVARPSMTEIGLILAPVDAHIDMTNRRYGKLPEGARTVSDPGLEDMEAGGPDRAGVSSQCG